MTAIGSVDPSIRGGSGKAYYCTLSRSTSFTEQTLVKPNDNLFNLPPHKVNAD